MNTEVWSGQLMPIGSSIMDPVQNDQGHTSSHHKYATQQKKKSLQNRIQNTEELFHEKYLSSHTIKLF